jgi:DNA gyrase subunit B
VLNVEKARLEKLLKNNEIAALISAVGVDILNVEDVSKVRYGKIIILTDADVDGQHIRTLLLTFFFRQMRKLVEDGHVYVSRPPLYKVVQKKETRFVQTREEMARELIIRGLKDTALIVTGDGRPGATTPRTVGSDDLGKMLPVLAEAETAVQNLERRGHTLDFFLPRKKADQGKDGPFPSYHVRFGGKDEWFHKADEVTKFRTEQAAKLGRELVLADDLVAPSAAGEAVPPPVVSAADEAARYTLDEWHEVRALNRAIAKLKASGFEPEDLIPLPRLAGRDPAVRYVLDRDGSRKELTHLRELVAEVRRLGEKGMTVTRFKGLGEMDPEELWETTLDPRHRTLLQVTLNDAQRAEELFRTLMGEEVEGRKQFIMDHKINNPEDIDYGA